MGAPVEPSVTTPLIAPLPTARGASMRSESAPPMTLAPVAAPRPPGAGARSWTWPAAAAEGAAVPTLPRRQTTRSEPRAYEACPTRFTERLLPPQRDDGVDPRGAACRQPGGGRGHKAHDDENRDQRHRIGRLHAEELRLDSCDNASAPARPATAPRAVSVRPGAPPSATRRAVARRWPFGFRFLACVG